MPHDIDYLLKRIQSIKRTPAKQMQMEARLKKRVTTHFKGLISSAAGIIQDLDYIPGPNDPTTAEIRDLFRTNTGPYIAIVARANAEAYVMGQRRLKVRGRARKESKTVPPGVPPEYLPYLIYFEGLVEPSIALMLLDQCFEASAGTMDRVTGDVMANLAVSYTEGVGNYQASVNLFEVFQGIQMYEAERIARTEINSAQNYGAFLQLESAGVSRVQWITALDSRVRGLDMKDSADHISMHGETVKLGEEFSNGLQYPGDRAGPIEEWINCRCQLRDA